MNFFKNRFGFVMIFIGVVVVSFVVIILAIYFRSYIAIIMVIEVAVLSVGVSVACISIFSYGRTEKLKVTLGIVYEITISLLSRNGVDILRLIKSDNNNTTGEYLASNYLKRSESLKH